MTEVDNTEIWILWHFNSYLNAFTVLKVYINLLKEKNHITKLIDSNYMNGPTNDSKGIYPTLFLSFKSKCTEALTSIMIKKNELEKFKMTKRSLVTYKLESVLI
jgi:hypothetical protein